MMSENDSTAGVCVKPLEVTGVEIDLDSGEMFIRSLGRLVNIAHLSLLEASSLPKSLRTLAEFHCSTASMV